MATYHAKIPSGVSASQVFDAVSAEVVGAMDGISVSAHGDERIGEYFSVSDDEVFKACADTREVLQKLCDGSSVGYLCVSGDGWSVQLCRHYTKIVVDDCTVPSRDYYSVIVTLIGSPCFGDDAAVQQEYTRWLAPLEEADTANRITRSYGVTKDVWMSYRIRSSQVPAFMRRLGVGDRSGVEAYGEVQETGKITSFSLDLDRYGFRGLYSVYPEWPFPGVTNYSSEACGRFCALIDAHGSGVLASLGRRHCAFRCRDGRSTRTLEGNRFDVYRTKTRRSLTVSFDQYADEDPPVRTFSGGVRTRLAVLGVKL